MKNKLDSQYIDILQNIIETGDKKSSRIGDTLSVFGCNITHKMNTGFPLLTTKKVYWKGIVVELLWFLSGRTDLKYLVDNDCNIWVGDAYKKYCGITSINGSYWNDFMYKNEDGSLRIHTRAEFIDEIKNNTIVNHSFGNLGPIYGFQWRNFNNEEIDQLQNVINTLRTNPDDRRMIVSSWNPLHISYMIVPPCHYNFQLYSGPENENGQRTLSLIWNQRSCDVPLGIPFNIASYGLLLMILAKHVNMIPDKLIGNFGDTHIYLNQLDAINTQIKNEPFELPEVELSNEIDWTQPIDDLLHILMQDPLKYIILKNYQSHDKITIPLSN